MEYELQLNPFVRKAGWKYKTIQITDIALHTSPKQTTFSIGKKIAKAFRKMVPGRIYGGLTIDTAVAPPPERKSSLIEVLKRDPDFVKMIRDEEQNGYKVLLAIPKEIPVIAGKDTVEFMASVNGKRIMRGLAKNE